jgi:FdhE protein
MTEGGSSKMTQVGSSKHAPISIGEIAKPPFARLPDPKTLFARRSERLRVLAEGHDLGLYLSFLAGLTDVQHRVQEDLPAVEPPNEKARARARAFGMPPLDRLRFTTDTAFDATFERLLPLADALEMPAPARRAIERVRCADAVARTEMAKGVLANAVAVEMLAEHVFAAAIVQVHFTRLAAELDASRLVPVGDGVCPACGGPPLASVIVGWRGAHGTRFCSCALCGTLWNYVRIKCTLCGSTKGITYRAIEGDAGTVKAETCDSCHCYVKILQQHVDPSLEALADDVASLALDLLVREAGYRRGAVNPFMLGY